MEDNGFITQEEAREARGESVWVLAREAEKQSYGWYIDCLLYTYLRHAEGSQQAETRRRYDRSYVFRVNRDRIHA